MLIVGKGQEITHALAVKLDNFSSAGTIEKRLWLWFPRWVRLVATFAFLSGKAYDPRAVYFKLT
jgi:hypothetical protein